MLDEQQALQRFQEHFFGSLDFLPVVFAVLGGPVFLVLALLDDQDVVFYLGVCLLQSKRWWIRLGEEFLADLDLRNAKDLSSIPLLFCLPLLYLFDLLLYLLDFYLVSFLDEFDYFGVGGVLEDDGGEQVGQQHVYGFACLEVQLVEEHHRPVKNLNHFLHLSSHLVKQLLVIEPPVLVHVLHQTSALLNADGLLVDEALNPLSIAVH